ncbi:hypothetical protein BUALT_Bualt01G0029200 [Buddleja alternifolia]|uniref:WAT1-related protein n=1 Tax=Buddleja alternifolia TaxID=168488 RepID=A0AAV6Y429_9LAMI|nr:hypothetical protein BUALT_Bualt01G0029200 [Buddleja alternifolia]
MEGDFLPFFLMTMLQFGYAGMNITSKLAMDSGMHPFVFVAYRQISATIAIAPFAYFMERVTLNQFSYFVGLKNSTPTIGCAMNNISPAVTFIIAVLLRSEKLGLKSKAGQAKVLGTMICTFGAFILSFYHGPIVNIGESSLHWKYAEKMGTNTSINHVNLIFGPFLLFVGVVSWSVYLIIQGIVCSALTFCALWWCLKRKGPLYVAVFSPLLLVIVAIFSWAFLGEKMYVGKVIGSVLIVLGLYGVLWGKKCEMSTFDHTKEVEKDKTNNNFTTSNHTQDP